MHSYTSSMESGSEEAPEALELGLGRRMRVRYKFLSVLLFLLFSSGRPVFERWWGRPMTRDEIWFHLWFTMVFGLLTFLSGLRTPLALRNGRDRLLLDREGQAYPLLGRFLRPASVPWEGVRVRCILGNLVLWMDPWGPWGQWVSLGRGARARRALSWLSRQGVRDLPAPR